MSLERCFNEAVKKGISTPARKLAVRFVEEGWLRRSLGSKTRKPTKPSGENSVGAEDKEIAYLSRGDPGGEIYRVGAAHC